MFKITLKTILAGSILLVSSLSFASDVDMSADINDLSIKGYDPVSYFTMSTPKMGNANYTATHKGGIYRFISEKNRDLFKENPEKYAPQYGGYCAFGVTKEKKFETDPLAWKIIADKLYLNLNTDVQKQWLTDVPGYLKISTNTWTEIKDVPANEL